MYGIKWVCFISSCRDPSRCLLPSIVHHSLFTIHPSTSDAICTMILSDSPPEIIHLICEFLDVTDVRIFRLVCRTIGSTAASHAFPELVFFLHHGDFEMLRYFADHPIYPRHVKSLVYSCDVLEPRRLSFKKFVAEKRQREDVSWRFRSGLELKKTKKRVPPPPKEDSEEFLKSAYQRYTQAHDQQDSMLAEGFDFTVLREVIPKFSNLKDIMISADLCFREGRRHKKPFDALFTYSSDYLKPSGCRHVGSLLLPLVGSPTIQLRSLRLGTVDWSFLEQLQEPSRLDQMIEICRNLTTFELHLDTGADWDADWDAVGIHMAECRAAVKKGGLRRLLGSMIHLEVLTIEFTYPDKVNGIYPAAFSDLIPEGMRWENLQEFTFSLTEATRQEMVDFIRRHSSTVTQYYLKDLKLIRSSWLAFLPKLREMADEMFLDDVMISGNVYGESEGDGLPLGIPAGGEEYFYLGDPDMANEHHLADDITDYIIWGECRNPLEYYDLSEVSEASEASEASDEI